MTRVHLAAGKTAHVHLTIQPRGLNYVNETGDRLIALGAYQLSVGGGQPSNEAQVKESTFTIAGEAQLPE